MLATEQVVAPEAVGTVRHLRRTAIKMGDNYVTLECEVTVLAGASDEQIAEAVKTAMRIAAVQEVAQEEQITQLLAHIPEPPATERQLQAIGRLRARVSDATTAAVYAELGIIGAEPRTKAQASLLIDRLQAIANGIAPDPAAAPEETAATGEQAEEDLPF